MDNIKELIDTCLDDPKYAESRRAVKNETWEFVGEGASRVADYLITKLNEINSSK